MGRRGLSSLQAVVIVAFVLLAGYGYYTYNELQTELRKRDSREERVKRQLDTVSSELESLYEQKSNIEKSMKTEQDENKKSKDELERHAQAVEAQCAKEKRDLSSHVDAVVAENKKLQSRLEDLERDLNKLNERGVKLEEDKNQIAEQYKEEYMQLKTNRDATITQLKAKVAQLEQQTAYDEDKLKVRANDILSLQKLLNTSRLEYSNLENHLEAVQHDLAQQRQRNQDLLAHQERLKNADVDGNQAKNPPQHAAAADAVGAADTVAPPAVLAPVGVAAPAAEVDGDKVAINQQHVSTPPRHNADLNRQQDYAAHKAIRRGQDDANDENGNAKLGIGDDKGDEDEEAAML